MENLDDFFAADLPEVESDDVTHDEPDTTTEVETNVEAPEEPETTEKVETSDDVEEVEPANTQPRNVPVAALTAERSKAREAQAEVEKLRAELARFQQPAPQAQQQNVQPNIPDPYDDPTAYHQFMMVQARQEMQVQNLNYSRMRAVEKHGQETINEAADWAGEQASRNPNFEAELLAQPDPAEWVIAQKKRNDLIKSFEADPDAYVRNRAAELAQQTTAQVVLENPTPARKPQGPTSIVNAKSRDSRQPASPEDAFDAIFNK